MWSSIARMSVAVLFLLVSGPQMVSTAPISQQRADGRQNDASLTSDGDSNPANDWMEWKYLPHADVLDVDTTLKYTHGHGIVINSFQEPLLSPDIVSQHSDLLGLIHAGKPGRPLSPDGEQQSIQVAELPTKDQEKLDSTISDLVSQLQTDLSTGLVSTVGLLPDIDIASNADTGVVVVNNPLQIEAVEAEDDLIVTNEEIQQNTVPAVFNLANLFPQTDSTASSVPPSSSDNLSSGLPPFVTIASNANTDVVVVNNPLQIEAVEAEDDLIVTNEEIQQNTIPAVFNLANLFPQTDSSSSSAPPSSSDNLSSGGIIGGSVSSTSIANPFILLFSYGLAVASVFVLSLPFWVPFVVAKRRRASASLRKKRYALNKSEAPLVPENQTTKQPHMNHQQHDNNKLAYSDYDRVPVVTQQPTAAIANAYRPGGSPDFSSEIGLHLGPYSDLFGISLWNRSKDRLKDPGPLRSKGVYGPVSNFSKNPRRHHNIRRLPTKNH